MSRNDAPSEVLEADGRPTSLRGRIGLAFKRDPTKGLVVLLLALFGLSFLLAGVVVFWNDIVGLLIDFFGSLV